MERNDCKGCFVQWTQVVKYKGFRERLNDFEEYTEQWMSENKWKTLGHSKVASFLFM